MTSVLIVGAGIAGLTTALSREAVGIECRGVDKVRELSAVGAGINLQPHAVFDRFGNRIWREPRGVAAGYRWPQYSIHRGTLQTLLLDEVRKRLGEDSVRVGLAFESRVETADGAPAHPRGCRGDRRRRRARRRGRPVLGRSGLGTSGRAGTGRRRDPDVARDDGGPPFLTGRTMIVAGSNSAATFVAYPITLVADGRTTINWVAEVRMPDDDLRAGWTARGRLTDVLPHYADWRFAWLDVPELIRGSAAILEYPIVDRDPLPWWGTRRVTLAGGAAHPRYPIGSNGGSQAILDARVLAYCLATEPDPVTALAGYETASR